MFRQISVFKMFHLEEWSLRIITLHLHIYILKIAESLREPRKNEIGKEMNRCMSDDGVLIYSKEIKKIFICLEFVRP